jgi:hypothetical protein
VLPTHVMVDHFTKPNGNFINVCDGGNSSVGFATWSSQESSTAEIDELIESDVTALVIIPYVTYCSSPPKFRDFYLDSLILRY